MFYRVSVFWIRFCRKGISVFHAGHSFGLRAVKGLSVFYSVVSVSTSVLSRGCWCSTVGCTQHITVQYVTATCLRLVPTTPPADWVVPTTASLRPNNGRGGFFYFGLPFVSLMQGQAESPTWIHHAFFGDRGRGTN